MALSPDGTLLATRLRHYPAPNPVSLVTIADGKEVAKLADLPEESVAAMMAFSPDGKMLALGGDGGMLGIYGIPDGKLLRSWHAAVSGKRFEALAWSPDGTRIATTASNHDAHIWSAANGTLLADLQPDVVDRPNSFAWSPDASVIAIGTYGTPDSPPATFMPGGGYFTDIALVRTSDGKHLQRLHGHTAAITDLAMSADGHLLVSASDDGTLRFWGVP
jgi:WD40 repeat protein